MSAHPFDPASGPLSELDGRVFLVSASAGTGKTWMISDLASRWLLEEEGRRPESILMVTFSRSAATELKSRLRGRLLEIRAALESPSSVDVASLPIWLAELVQDTDSARAQRAISLQRLRKVLPLLEGVNARTIHSFAAAATSSGRQTSSGEGLFGRAVNETITKAVFEDPEGLLSLQESVGGRRDLGKVLSELASKTSALGGLEEGVFSRAVLAPFDEPTRREESLLASLVREVTNRMIELQSLDSTSTYDFLISNLFRVVTSVDADADAAALVEGIRRAFDLVLIDEFQDTDQAQWEIFSDVFVGHVPVVIVGDPKQAIYRFRGGDVVIFQDLLDRAHREPDGFRTHTLRTNRRSSPRLVGQLNVLFRAAELLTPDYAEVSIRAGDGDGDDTSETPSRTIPRTWGFSTASDQEGLKPISYELVAAHRTAETAGLEIRDVRTRPKPTRDDLSSSRVYPEPGSVGNADDAVCEDLGQVLLDRLAGEPDADELLRRVTVLVRTGTQATQVRDHLRRLGIPAVLSATESVFQSPAAKQLRLLLWAISDATNPRRSGLLVHSWFADHADSVRHLAEALMHFGPGAMTRRALDGATTARILSEVDGERNWTDLEQLLELLAAAFPRSVAPQIAQRWLEDQITRPAEDQGDGSSEARRIESDRASVRIMTVHKSKGLEFDIVLFPFPETGGFGITPDVYALSGPKGRTFDLGALVGKQVAVERADALQETDEGARRMYVALTRARDEVIAWVSDRSELHADRPDSADPIFKSSLWLQLAQPVSFLNVQELEMISAECDAAGAPHDLPRWTNVEGADLAELEIEGTSRRQVSTSDVASVPWIDERLRRRWSYSYLGVAGVDVLKPSRDDAEDDDGFDARGLAESESLSVETDLVHEPLLFGGFSGTSLGNALHGLLEDFVGVLDSNEVLAQAPAISQAFEREGLSLLRPDVVSEQLASVMAVNLGPLFRDASLEDLKALPGESPRVAKEMNFTLHLAGRGKVRDLIVDIASAGLDKDPDGLFVEYFKGLAREPERAGRLFQGFLTGSIDLVAQVDETPRFVIVDYKSNLASKGSGYSPADLIPKMAKNGYPLQALLYSVALHRYLSIRLDGYEAEKNLGGALYLFLRGMVRSGREMSEGLCAWEIPPTLISEVSRILGEGELS